MTETLQRQLPMTVAQCVTLVPVDVVRARLGCDTESVATKIDSGELIWVWDFAAPGARHRRELRFWMAELRGLPEGRQHADPEDVIRQVIGSATKERERSAVIEINWSLSPQHIRTLVDAKELEGPIVGHTRYLSRRSMEEFLRRRLVR